MFCLNGKYPARTHTGVAADLTTGADERTRRPGVASDMTSIGEHASESVLPFVIPVPVKRMFAERH